MGEWEYHCDLYTDLEEYTDEYTDEWDGFFDTSGVYSRRKTTMKAIKGEKNMDINNLPEILKNGETIGNGTRAILQTPVARASFVNLVDMERPFIEGDPATKNSISLLFETAPGNPAAVDLKKAFLPFFKSVLAEYQVNPKFDGFACSVGKQDLIKSGEIISAKGEVYAGTSPSIVSIKANHTHLVYNKAGELEKDNGDVPVYGIDGKLVDPSVIYSGCYVRCKIGIYKPKAWPAYKMSLTLKSVQFVADGEPLGAGAATMDALPGADIPAETPNGDLSEFVS